MRGFGLIRRPTGFTSLRFPVSTTSAQQPANRGPDSQRVAGAQPALLYADLARAADEVASFSGPGSKKKTVDVLRKLFVTARQSHIDDLKTAVKLLLCRPKPANEGFKLGVGSSTLVKSVAETFGENVTELRRKLGSEGDLGALAGQLAESRGHPGSDLTAKEVLGCVLEIGAVSGSGAHKKREDMIVALLRRAPPSAVVYIVRTLLGKGLRIGAGEASVLQALEACLHPHDGKPAHGAMVLQSALVQPDFDQIIDHLSSSGDVARLAPGGIRLGTPVRPMLATPRKGFAEVEAQISKEAEWSGKWTAEWKYDGMRLQIHAGIDGNTSCRLFSRALKDVSAMFPDVVKCVDASLKENVRSAVLDAEVVAVDSENGEILPFQSLMQRKKVASQSDITAPVKVFVFDCLQLNGKDVLLETLVDRRAALHSSFRAGRDIRQVEHRCVNSRSELEAAFHEAVAARTEGLVIKSLADSYGSAVRSSSWMKLKKDFVKGEGLADSIDAIVVGAKFGRGKRSGVFGSFLMAVRGHETGVLQSLCWIGTGLSDEELGEFGASLETREDAPEGLTVLAGCARPDAWIEDGPVWEVQGADLTRSAVHSCCQGLLSGSDGGLSLRFPRVIRARASIDKDASTATSACEVLRMYDSRAGA